MMKMVILYPQKGEDPSKIKKSVVLYSILNKSSYEKSGWIFRESSDGGEEPPGAAQEAQEEPRRPRSSPGGPGEAQDAQEQPRNS